MNPLEVIFVCIIIQFIDCATITKLVSSTSSGEHSCSLSKLLIKSLFPNIPPSIKFLQHNESANKLSPQWRHGLIWKSTGFSHGLIRSVVEKTGFTTQYHLADNEWTGIYAGRYQDGMVLQPHQKINHFPGSGYLGCKDKMWKNVQYLQKKHGSEEFKYIPETYVLPGEISKFKTAWERNDNKLWIDKNAIASKAKGIRIIQHWNQIEAKDKTRRVVQKFVHEPYLTDGVKTELRIYAMATSFQPLRLFILRDVIVNYGVVQYSQSTIFDLCVGLTNYIRLYPHRCMKHRVFDNNGNVEFEPVPPRGNDLNELLDKNGIETSEFWGQLEDLIIKAVLAAEYPITNSKPKLESRYNAFQFWGIDFVLDKNLRPHLLEFNSVPGMQFCTKQFYGIRSKAVAGLFTVAGYHLPPTLPKSVQKQVSETLDLKNGSPTFLPGLYTLNISGAAQRKKEYIQAIGLRSRDQYSEAVLKHLTPDDVRLLVIAEDELNRSQLYKRIFPSSNTYKYLKYVRSPPYYYMLLDAWEKKYGADRRAGIARLAALTSSNYHLRQ